MTESHEDQAATPLAACVQFDVHRGQIEANVATAVAGIEQAAAEGAKICVLPEMWSTSFMTTFDEAAVAAAQAAEQTLADLSARHNLVIVGSSFEAEDGAPYNCARVYDNGELKGSYRKLHMFSPNAEHRYYQAGKHPLLAQTSAGRIGVMIGYDLRFPELARYYFHAGAEILAIPAQWPETRSQHWRTLLRARAIESGLFVLGSNRTGQENSLKTDEVTAYLGDGRIVDPTGEILAAGSGEEGVIMAELELKTVRTLRRVLPIDRDQRPDVYQRMIEETLESMRAASRDNEQPSQT